MVLRAYGVWIGKVGVLEGKFGGFFGDELWGRCCITSIVSNTLEIPHIFVEGYLSITRTCLIAIHVISLQQHFVKRCNSLRCRRLAALLRRTCSLQPIQK